ADDAGICLRKYQTAVAAGSERPVDVDAAVPNVEELESRAGEHGSVTGRSASDTAAGVAAHRHSRAPSASRAAPREPNCRFTARPFSVASASCARKRSGSQI